MERKHRYIVLKIKDVDKYLDESAQEQLDDLCREINRGRLLEGKQVLRCVVVEDDWPEYLDVWAKIAARVDGTSFTQARMQQFQDYGEGDAS